MPTASESRYRTSDLYFAAYLKIAGVPLLDTEREGTRVFFVFEDGESIRDLNGQFFNRTAKVPALPYADEIRAMKNLTFMSS